MNGVCELEKKFVFMRIAKKAKQRDTLQGN